MASFKSRDLPSELRVVIWTTYAAWFLRRGWAQGGKSWQLELSAPQLRAVQRLCFGSHSLPVETGRLQR